MIPLSSLLCKIGFSSFWSQVLKQITTLAIKQTCNISAQLLHSGYGIGQTRTQYLVKLRRISFSGNAAQQHPASICIKSTPKWCVHSEHFHYDVFWFVRHLIHRSSQIYHQYWTQIVPNNCANLGMKELIQRKSLRCTYHPGIFPCAFLLNQAYLCEF